MTKPTRTELARIAGKHARECGVASDQCPLLMPDMNLEWLEGGKTASKSQKLCAHPRDWGQHGKQ